MGRSKLKILVRTFFVFTLLFELIILNQSSAQSQADSCGQPTFNRAIDRGIFLWQNCGNGDWFFRVTGGGRPITDEFKVEGNLIFSEPVKTISGFSLESGAGGSQDELDISNPQNVKFRMRVWSDAQDGVNFRIPNNSTACLIISNPARTPVEVGISNTNFLSPINLLTFKNGGCSSIMSSLQLLLL